MYLCLACNLEFPDDIFLHKHFISVSHQNNVRNNFPEALAHKSLLISNQSKRILPNKRNLYIKRKDGIEYQDNFKKRIIEKAKVSGSDSDSESDRY